MKRKIIQIADSTQLVSLPRKWAVEHGLKKGDEVDVKEEGNRIIVSSGERNAEYTETEIQIDGLDKDSLIFLLRGLYIRGYDQIRFRFDNPLIEHHRFNKKVTISSVIHKEVGICQGLDIIQESRNQFVIKNISVSSIKEFDNILRRVFLLLIDAAKDLHLGAKEGDFVLLESMQDKHDNITRLINYNLKTLNTIGYVEHKNNQVLFSILFSLDLVIDILKNVSREIIENKLKIEPRALDIMAKVVESIQLYYNLFYNFSFSKASSFVKAKQDVLDIIKKQIKNLSKEDVRIVVMVESALEVLRDLYSARMAMEY
ncbi:AbrB/MazE/SpoVT family DNA-binding domain-containing protein [Candidatus Woesearchaeota archaeon]|nr:AbrB/MazE/SpoVT family DNA-binding domain-containing protein [Candidatus Woesearchaeota archaeon]